MTTPLLNAISSAYCSARRRVARSPPRSREAMTPRSPSPVSRVRPWSAALFAERPSADARCDRRRGRCRAVRSAARCLSSARAGAALRRADRHALVRRGTRPARRRTPRARDPHAQRRAAGHRRRLGARAPARAAAAGLPRLRAACPRGRGDGRSRGDIARRSRAWATSVSSWPRSAGSSPCAEESSTCFRATARIRSAPSSSAMRSRRIRRFVPGTGQTIGDAGRTEVFPCRELVVGEPGGTAARRRRFASARCAEPEIAHHLETDAARASTSTASSATCRSSIASRAR